MIIFILVNIVIFINVINILLLILLVSTSISLI